MIDIANVEHIGDLNVLRPAIVPEHSRTGFHEGRPVAAAGVIPMWAGVAMGWVIVDKDLPEPLGVVRAMRRGMRDIALNGPFHRIQADVRKAYPKGQKLLKVLGFTHEGPLAAYTSTGEDYERWTFIDRNLVSA